MQTPYRHHPNCQRNGNSCSEPGCFDMFLPILSLSHWLTTTGKALSTIAKMREALALRAGGFETLKAMANQFRIMDHETRLQEEIGEDRTKMHQSLRFNSLRFPIIGNLPPDSECMAFYWDSMGFHGIPWDSMVFL